MTTTLISASSIRAWAKSVGIPTGERGRVHPHVIAAFSAKDPQVYWTAKADNELAASVRVQKRAAAPKKKRDKKLPPFEFAAATDEEIWNHIAGRQITWYNRKSHENEVARVTRTERHFRVDTNPAGEKVIHFSAETGFYSVRTDAIKRVK